MHESGVGWRQGCLNANEPAKQAKDRSWKDVRTRKCDNEYREVCNLCWWYCCYILWSRVCIYYDWIMICDEQ